MDGSQEDKSSSLWRKAFLKSYKAMDKELKSHPKVDCFCSGCTAVTLVKQVHVNPNQFAALFSDLLAVSFSNFDLPTGFRSIRGKYRGFSSNSRIER